MIRQPTLSDYRTSSGDVTSLPSPPSAAIGMRVIRDPASIVTPITPTMEG